MTAAGSAIIRRDAEEAGRPAVTYRFAGNDTILVEYGEMVFDLTLNFVATAVDDALRNAAIDGLVETAPGFRSLLIVYDPTRIQTDELIDRLTAIHSGLAELRSMKVPSRVVHLPIAFDDAASAQAVQRYVNGVRADAPNCANGTNIDYIVQYNGLADRDELYEAILATEMWTAFIGFFPGLPFMFPVDPRDAIFVPKYNPTRVWTAEGAVGLGGPCVAIYPVESAGGYQLFGRTLPIYDLQGRNEIFRENPLLLGPGDRVKFHRVEEDELLALWEDVHADRYRYNVENGTFDVGEHLEWVKTVEGETQERNARREEASAVTPVP